MKLRSIELVLPQAKAAAEFLTDIWGLAMSAVINDSYYLRGSGSFPYVIALREGDANAVRTTTFECAAGELSSLRERVVASGLHATPTSSRDLGGGEGLIVELPEGELFRFLVDAGEVEPLDDKDMPVKLTHVVMNSADAEATGDVLEKVLDFRVSDRTKMMVFVRCNAAHHSLAFARAGFSSLNHIAFEMADVDAVMRGIGRLRDHKMTPVWGPGRHGPGNNMFAYFVAPFGGIVEFSTAVNTVAEDHQPGRPEDWRWPENRIDQWGVSERDNAAISAAERVFYYQRNWDPAPL